MSDEESPAVEPNAYASAGDQLRAAREAQDLTLEHIASKTRIPLRHLEAIEAGDFGSLPARTYAVGFARSYAKAVGLDQHAVVDQVRADMGVEGPGERYASGEALEPGDPARVPSRGLVFFSIASILLLLAGGFMFYRTFFAPGSGPGSILPTEQAAREEATQQAANEAAASTGPAIDPQGEVVFTALEDEVWVKFYDDSGNRLMEKQMSKGERYTVPADAENPQIVTGRPYALGITIDGKPVAKLSEEAVTVADIPVSAEALLARNEAPAKAQTPAATPAAGTQG
ncbi:helix-turn-helix domain-containing protein [Erythrobacter sp. SDW2]|uniref:helix-turn-helix domain-containing protein n=1 Tax=Erythrobacter sp. SDW2 TaxID=2907154 RepID=UPI001F15B868|nr:helix-turn-helix domain-containing protein [Erythrobacter sp. SDW2]UIP06648.1 helix-turn-helix domain-containing protein [Erythrobacter sp. SDW2]